MALQILRKFGFRKHLVYDSKAEVELYKVEHLNHWLKHGLPKLGHAQFDIEVMTKDPNSHHLLEYLSLLSQFVNCNPGILNKNYNGESDEAIGVFYIPEDAKKLKLKAPHPCPAKWVLNPMLGYLINSKYVPKGAVTMGPPVIMSGGAKTDMYGGHGGFGILSPFGTPTFTPGLPMFRPKRFGEGESTTCKVIHGHLRNQGHDIIHDIFRGLISNLKSKGKSLSQKDYDDLKQKLENYKEIQDALLKTLCYMEEYARVLDVTGDNRAQTVSMNVMEKFASRYGKLFNQYHNMEHKIMADLISAAKEDVGVATDFKAI
jgi:hypothetical protein